MRNIYLIVKSHIDSGRGTAVTLERTSSRYSRMAHRRSERCLIAARKNVGSFNVRFSYFTSHSSFFLSSSICLCDVRPFLSVENSLDKEDLPAELPSYSNRFFRNRHLELTAKN